MVVWLVQGQTTLATILLLAVGSGIISALLGGWVLYRKVMYLCLQGVESAQTRLSSREMLRVAWPLLGSSLTVVLLSQADVWILGIFRSEEEVAIYGAASRLALPALVLVTWVLYAVLPPLIAEKYATGEMAILERLLRTGATVSAIIAFPVFVAFVLLPGKILGLVYGSLYESGAWILAILSLGHFVNVVTGLHGYVLTMTGYERTQLVIFAMGGALNVALCTFGAVYWGIYGVAFAAMTAQILQCLAELVAIYFRLGIRTYASLSSVSNIKKLLKAQMPVRRVEAKGPRFDA
jgi:O-antigen/teichoic acid export membrane protein